MEQLLRDTLHTAPITGTFILSLVVVLVHSFTKNSRTLEHRVTLAGIAANLALAFWVFPQQGTAFNGMILTGGFASVTAAIILTAGGLTVLLARDYLEKIGTAFGEVYMLIVMAMLGMMSFAAGTDLVVTFIGLELMSVCLYVLAGLSRRLLKANEAALKYFLLGAFATGFFLYGMALIYGVAGTTNILEIASKLEVIGNAPLFLFGTGLLLVGFAFKVGAVPFHMWVPDVYEGSPTIVTAFMSTGAKAAAFGALALVFSMTFGFQHTGINTVLAVLAVASMVVGNVVALSQSNVKRMLAYSSIAHAGYMLIGITTGSLAGVTGVLFYLLAYTFTNVGAFGIASIIENGEQKGTDIDDFTGLYFRQPLLAGLLAVFMFSLIGIPPLAGFFGKYYSFVAAIENGYTWLTIVGVITSMISVYYYLRVVVVMFFKSSDSAVHAEFRMGNAAALLISAFGLLAAGLFPSIVLDWMSRMF